MRRNKQTLFLETYARGVLSSYRCHHRQHKTKAKIIINKSFHFRPHSFVSFVLINFFGFPAKNEDIYRRPQKVWICSYKFQILFRVVGSWAVFQFFGLSDECLRPCMQCSLVVTLPHAICTLHFQCYRTMRADNTLHCSGRTAIIYNFNVYTTPISFRKQQTWEFCLFFWFFIQLTLGKRITLCEQNGPNMRDGALGAWSAHCEMRVRVFVGKR